MEKASYNKEAEDPAGFLDRSHNLSLCRINIKLYFLVHTDLYNTRVSGANQYCQQMLNLQSRVLLYQHRVAHLYVGNLRSVETWAEK